MVFQILFLYAWGMAHAIDYNTQVVPLELFADHPLRLAPEEHPNGYWSETHGNYNSWWAHYKGYSLNRKANGLDIYPVKLNIVRPAVINHAALLLGQFTDRIVRFGISNAYGVDKALGEEITRDLNMAWHLNSGDVLLLEQAMFQQIFGGMYWNVAWTPTRKRWPIRYFSVDPRACFPVWDGNDYNRLVAIDVIHQVPRPTAITRYRVTPSPFKDTEREFCTIKEHWDENEYEITVDGEIGRWPDGAKMGGPNPFLDPVLGVKVIPYVYAPRLRVGEFEGESLVPGLVGGMKELNNNLAHLNEGLADAMHQQPWVKGRPKGAAGFDQARNAWIDLGMGQPGSGIEPEIGRLEGADLSEAMIALVADKLPELIREHTNMPNVGYGRTDASVRSALTLHYMMWPATNVGAHYRLNASLALKQIGYLTYVIAMSKRKLGENLNAVESIGFNASDKHIEAILVGHKTHWPPMLPQDRSELVNEMVQRISSQLISRETAIRRLDGADELAEELERIEDDIQAEQERQMEMAEQQNEMTDEQADKDMDRNMQQAGHKNKLDMQRDKAKPKPSDRTNNAQAKGGRSKNNGK